MMTKLLLLLTIVVGPWVTGMHKTSCSILWTTEEESLAWVQLEDGTRIYEEFAGRRVHGRLHHVHLTGLQEGSKVTYFVGNRLLVDKSNPYTPKYGEETVQGPFAVRTFTSRGNRCRFSVINDMHMKVSKYCSLAAQIDTADTDFIFLNGDLISAGHHSTDSLAKYEISPLGRKAAMIPVMFARGNHEGRGEGIRNVAAVFPNNGPLPFTYMFREGPVAVLVFDSGETGGGNSLNFCGKTQYEDYLRAQMEWAHKAMSSRDWKTAKARICIVHAPMIDFGVPDDFYVHTWMNHNLVPELSRAGVDLMIGADLHEYIYKAPGEMGNSFPIIVNDSSSRADVTVEGKRISVVIFDREGNSTVLPVI